MAVTDEERLTNLENSLNRLMEAFEEITSIDEASEYARRSDSNTKSFGDRLLRLEEVMSTIESKYEVYKKRVQ